MSDAVSVVRKARDQLRDCWDYFSALHEADKVQQDNPNAVPPPLSQRTFFMLGELNRWLRDNG